MTTLKLIYNELVKIFKRKIVYIFAIIILVSIIASCILVHVKMKKEAPQLAQIISESDLALSISQSEYQLTKDNLTDYDRKVIEKSIELDQYVLDNGVENVLTAQYKLQAQTLLENLYKKLYSLDENENKELYDMQKANIDRLWEIFKSGTFEEYVQFNKELLKQQLDNKEITEEEYNLKMESQDEILRYEIGKYMPSNTVWKERVIGFINWRKSYIETRMDLTTEKVYLEDKDIERIKDELLIDEYRLENNLPPYYTEYDREYDIESYSRYNYNNFANTLAVVGIGLLIIILASSSVADEMSKGTIKFTLIMPYKRWQLLLAKIVALFITTVVMVLVVSQVSVLIGNIAFGVNNNEYLYVKNGEVKIMSTHIYETLQYLLRIPELVIYLLIAITFSSLTKNVPISTAITSAQFIGIPPLVDLCNQLLVDFAFVKYLPFTNFDFIGRALKIETYLRGGETLGVGEYVNPVSIETSIAVLSITAILLIITVFDSFNKKQI